jgi:hypothetical protein
MDWGRDARNKYQAPSLSLTFWGLAPRSQPPFNLNLLIAAELFSSQRHDHISVAIVSGHNGWAFRIDQVDLDRCSAV